MFLTSFTTSCALPSVLRRSPYRQRPGRRVWRIQDPKIHTEPAFRSEASASWMTLKASATSSRSKKHAKPHPSVPTQNLVRPTGYQLSLTPGRSSHIPSPVHARDVHICAKCRNTAQTIHVFVSLFGRHEVVTHEVFSNGVLVLACPQTVKLFWDSTASHEKSCRIPFPLSVGHTRVHPQ